MKQQSQKITFRGNILLFVKQGYVYFLPICLLLSFMMVGKYCFFHFFIFILVLSLPGVFFLYIIGFPLNRFSFDDEKKQIVKFLTGNIPYRKVKAIYIVEYGKLLNVSIKKGWLQKAFLAMALDIKEKRQVVEELLKRFPKEILHQRKLSQRKFIMRFMLPVFLMFSILEVYIYWKIPQVRVVPQRKNWEIAQNLLIREQKKYTLERVAFLIPSCFKLVKVEEQKLLFENKDKKAKLIATPGLFKKFLQEPSPMGKFLFFYGMGIVDSYELYQAVYYARFGIIPLTLKSVVLGNLDEIKIYEIKKVPFKGFIMQGTKNGREFTDILLVDKKKKNEINFTISSSGKIEEEILKIIVDSVKSLE